MKRSLICALCALLAFACTAPEKKAPETTPPPQEREDEMLDGTADATGDVEFRTDRHAGLADLALTFTETGIDGGAGSADAGANQAGELVKQLEILLAAHAIAAGHDDLSAFDVDLLLFDFPAQDLDCFVGSVKRGLYGDRNDRALIRRIKHFLFHHALADGRHLRPRFRAHDGGDDIAAKGRPDLIQDVLVGFLGLGIFMRSDLPRIPTLHPGEL